MIYICSTNFWQKGKERIRLSFKFKEKLKRLIKRAETLENAKKSKFSEIFQSKKSFIEIILIYLYHSFLWVLSLPFIYHFSYFSISSPFSKLGHPSPATRKNMKYLWNYKLIVVQSLYEQYIRHIFFILMVWNTKNIVMVIHNSYIYLKHGQKQLYRRVFA